MNDQAQVAFPQFKIHNRTGSVKFTLKPAYYAGESFQTRDGRQVQVLKKGYLMVEMANAAGQPEPPGSMVYDWANKVAMKLSDGDIQQLLGGMQGRECKIVHDPNKAGGDGNLPKSFLNLSKGGRFGWFMSMSRGDKKARCPISDGDAATFCQLLSRAVVKIYGW